MTTLITAAKETRSYDVWLSLNGSRKEKTVNSRNGGLKVFEKQEF